jgi:hypothetical protein
VNAEVDVFPAALPSIFHQVTKFFSLCY